MVELYDTDFVLFKNGEPVEPLDVVYAIESVQELLDGGFELEDGEAFISMTALPLEWQNKYIEALSEGSDELFIKLDHQLGELVSSLLKTDEILWEDDAYRDEYHRLRNSLMNLIHRVNTNK